VVKTFGQPLLIPHAFRILGPINCESQVSSLATIAAAAPLLGIFGTVLGIGNSFRGIEGEKSALLAMLEERLSDSLLPTELGLFVAMLAFCAFRYFSAKLNDADIEMENASLQLMNELGSTRFC
jgi:biopolymer transport protein ExbB/TolQ